MQIKNATHVALFLTNNTLVHFSIDCVIGWHAYSRVHIRNAALFLMHNIRMSFQPWGGDILLICKLLVD